MLEVHSLNREDQMTQPIKRKKRADCEKAKRPTQLKEINEVPSLIRNETMAQQPKHRSVVKRERMFLPHPLPQAHQV